MNSSQAIEDTEESKEQNVSSTANASIDMTETESIHERQESLPEYEDVEETTLIHDRSMNLLTFSFMNFI